MGEKKEYIERGAFLRKCTEAWGHYGVTIKAIEGIADECAAADVVSRGVFEQVKWERDMAMQQLEEHGIPFGAKADVVEVRHGEWIEHDDDWCGAYYTCSACGCDWTTIDGTPQENNMKYCPNCGAKMDGERKEQT